MSRLGGGHYISLVIMDVWDSGSQENVSSLVIDTVSALRYKSQTDLSSPTSGNSLVLNGNYHPNC